MSTNDPETADTGKETAAIVNVPANAPNTARTTSTNLSNMAVGTLDAEELSQLERDMQLKDPADVVLPGGKTLKEVIDTRQERQIAAAREASEKNKDAELPPSSSTVMTTKSVIAIGHDGEMVTVPLSPPPTDENQPRG